MVFFNYTTMQVSAKIVYYGPGLCGKTTNLQQIHGRTDPSSRGEMVSLETEADRTLFFDLLPLEVGTIGGMRVRLQLYTVPGQVFYNTTRKLVLKGVDGIVFVADSQVPALDANIESFENLQQNLKELNQPISKIPFVFQYNKRDLRHIHSVETLNRHLNPSNCEVYEGAAVHGIGVFETLKSISRRTLAAVHRKISGDDSVSVPPPPVPSEPSKEAAAPERAPLEPVADEVPVQAVAAHAEAPAGEPREPREEQATTGEFDMSEGAAAAAGVENDVFSELEEQVDATAESVMVPGGSDAAVAPGAAQVSAAMSEMAAGVDAAADAADTTPTAEQPAVVEAAPPPPSAASPAAEVNTGKVKIEFAANPQTETSVGEGSEGSARGGVGKVATKSVSDIERELERLRAVAFTGARSTKQPAH